MDDGWQQSVRDLHERMDKASCQVAQYTYTFEANVAALLMFAADV
jgi:hypothetical protein